MKDEYFKEKDNYKIINNIDNNKIIEKFKIEDFIFYDNNDYSKKYDVMPDKELEKLMLAALRINRSNAASTPIPTPTPTPVPTQTQIPTKPVFIPTPTPTPVINPKAASVPAPTSTDAVPDFNAKIQRFLDDTTSATVDRNFRGWVLPNGQLVSQYYENGSLGRQDHGALVRLFINGLQEYDSAKYDELMAIYDDYVSRNHNARDVYESFAVDALGWMQVSEFGTKRIIARQERWQDRLLAPFIIDFGYDLVSSNNPNQGLCYNGSFFRLYDDIKQIITLGLERRYSSGISR